MHMITLTLTCLAWLRQGQGMHNTPTHLQVNSGPTFHAELRHPKVNQQLEARNVLKALATFLSAFNPVARLPTASAKTKTFSGLGNPCFNRADQRNLRSSSASAPAVTPYDFWNQRYQTYTEPYDWLGDYTDLRALIERVTGGDKDARILVPGCGNSLLTEHMYDDGYHHIANTDVSEVVISQMKERNANRSEMIWATMDSRVTPYDDHIFDLIIDKGLLDSFLITDKPKKYIAPYMKEMLRILRPGGFFLCISCDGPSLQRRHFDKPHLDWIIEELDIPQTSCDGNLIYAYLCQKANGRNANKN